MLVYDFECFGLIQYTLNISVFVQWEYPPFDDSDKNCGLNLQQQGVNASNDPSD
jgi:hypothetical protein